VQTYDLGDFKADDVYKQALLQECVDLLWELACLIETQQIKSAARNYRAFISEMYENGEHRKYVRAIYLVSLLLPYEATASFCKFVDAIGAHLRTVSYDSGLSKQAYQKLTLIQLGLWFLNKPGRETFVCYVACILYTLETQFKLRIAVEIKSPED